MIKTFVFDNDGVIQDYTAMLDKVATNLGFSVCSNTYSIRTRYGISKLEERLIYKRISNRRLLRNLSELNGAFDVLKQLQEAGHKIIIATAIDDVLYDDRMSSYTKHDFVPDKLYCVGNSGKESVYEHYKPDYIFDDQHHHLLEGINHCQNLICINDGIPQKKVVEKTFETYKTVKDWYDTSNF